jgi:hypothetical protein
MQSVREGSRHSIEERPSAPGLTSRHWRLRILQLPGRSVLLTPGRKIIASSHHARVFLYLTDSLRSKSKAGSGSHGGEMT